MWSSQGTWATEHTSTRCQLASRLRLTLSCARDQLLPASKSHSPGSYFPSRLPHLSAEGSCPVTVVALPQHITLLGSRGHILIA